MRRLRAALPKGRRYLVRWVAGSAAGAFAAAAFTASALGVAFGPGETLTGKAWDAVAAVPRVFSNLPFYWSVVGHPVRTARIVHEGYERLEYAREHMPSAEDLDAGARALSSQAGRLELGESMIREGLDSIARRATLIPLDGSLPVSSSLNTIRTGVRLLPAPDSLSAVARRGAALADATRAVLETLPYQETYDALMDALANLDDNFAADERAATTLLIVLMLAATVTSPVAAHYWIRRGRPGLVATLVMRRGMAHWPDVYADEAKGWPIYARLKEEILEEERRGGRD